MSTPVPFNDGDPAWQSFAGTVRFRTAGNVAQIQVSSQNADGVTFDVATIVIPGAYLRDVRRGSVSQFPSYNSAGLPTNFASDTQRRAAEVLAANAEGRIPTDNPLPVIGGSGH